MVMVGDGRSRHPVARPKMPFYLTLFPHSLSESTSLPNEGTHPFATEMTTFVSVESCSIQGFSPVAPSPGMPLLPLPSSFSSLG